MLRLLLAITVAIGADAVQAEDRLCFGTACSDASCGATVAPADVARPFVLTTAVRTHVLGILAARATEIACTGSAVELRIASKAAPGGTHVIIRDERDVRWELPLSASDIGEPLTLRMARGAYRLEIEAPHAVRHRATFDVDGDTARVAATLVPLPVLTGTVTEKATKQPLGGAIVHAGEDYAAVTDAAGRFRIELDPEQWPELLTIDAIGFGQKAVAVPGTRVSASLDEIQLAPAGAIAVRIEQTNPGEVMRVQLLERAHGESTGRVVKSVEVAPTDPAPVIRFDSLDAGHYVVMAQGDEVWERRGELADLAGGETKELLLRIAPFPLSLRAEFRGQPLRKARFFLTSRDGLWTERLDADDSGEAAMQLWQGGRMKVAVLDDEMNVPHIARKTVSETGATQWHIVVPNHEISGVVLDSKSGKPVPNAAVALNIRASDGQLGVKTRSDDNGVFRFAPVPHGKHTLKAAAASYPPGEIAYTFLEPETTRKIVIRLDAASTVALTVVDSAGAPVAGAQVIDYRGIQRLGLSTTDATGQVRIPLPAGEMRDVFVIPREGSFAFTTLRHAGEPVTLRVPPATSRITLRAESTAQDPIPNVSVVVRYDGRVLPPAVLEALVALQGSRANSDSQGRIVFRTMPAGVYEFWPVASDAELRAVAGGAGPAAPVKIAAAPGENVAVLTFAAAP